ncbi:MAG: sigma-70 family RNA polymerase sigma factor [Planctomycetia bacterium]|nr:sigma-70 family RNA polymerase sigma factor [Planctomycetia bacterium]
MEDIRDRSRDHADAPMALERTVYDDTHVPMQQAGKVESYLYGTDDEINTSLTKMFEVHREQLLRMIEVRLHPDLRGQIDSQDVLQETFMEAFRQLKNHISQPKTSALVWLRLIVGQQLIMFHRRYVQAQKRNVAREISLNRQQSLQSDSLSMSGVLVGKLTAPSFAARRQELILRLRECLEELNPDDREILSLRHFEQLSNAETAEELKINANTASVRYIRALKKFREILVEHHLDELLE